MRIGAGGEGELSPVEAGPRLQIPEAGGDAVVLFVLLLRIQQHLLLPALTCLVYHALREVNGTQTTELIYLGFDAESTMYQLCDLAQVT